MVWWPFSYIITWAYCTLALNRPDQPLWLVTHPSELSESHLDAWPRQKLHHVRVIASGHLVASFRSATAHVQASHSAVLQTLSAAFGADLGEIFFPLLLKTWTHATDLDPRVSNTLFEDDLSDGLVACLVFSVARSAITTMSTSYSAP